MRFDVDIGAAGGKHRGRALGIASGQPAHWLRLASAAQPAARWPGSPLATRSPTSPHLPRCRIPQSTATYVMSTRTDRQVTHYHHIGAGH